MYRAALTMRSRNVKTGPIPVSTTTEATCPEACPLRRNGFKTKKALKEAIAAGERVTVYQPGPFGGSEPREGRVFLEGPHYPAAHTWYAQGTLQDGVLVKVT